MDLRGKKIEFADTSEVEEREREVRYIFNIVQPDPEYQPIFLSDESTLLDATSYDEAECRRRLEGYFGSAFPCSLHQLVWRLVDDIKQKFPGWPDEFIARH
jgi:hypothetical protein